MRTTFIAIAGLLLAACTAAAPAATPGAPSVTPAQPTVAPATPTATAPPVVATEEPATPVPTSAGATPTIELPDLVGEVPQEILLPIMQQVADATGASLADLTLLEARSATWSDSSLGCPEPGQMYTQALVEGFWVVIEVGTDTYDFRVGDNGEVKLCPEGQGEPPIGTNQ